MTRDGVALIGIGCRFPGGATSPSSWWDFVRDGGDGVGPVPPERWGDDALDPDPRTPGRAYAAMAGFLQDPSLSFDAAFFGISPREAETLDPQQRMLLEVAWEAIDDAGARIEDLRGSSAGVFIGGFTLDNMLIRFRDLDAIDSHTATSSSMTMLSNRISYAFDLRGPSLTLDTACSSSLVAIHLACRALRERECDVALAGGVNAMLAPNFPVVMCKGRFLAADGRSKAFDADADGYGRGEGAAIVALKRLDDALRDGDRIHAVIAGTGVNQDGATDGIAQPNGAAQRALIRAVCARHGIDPARVGYIEAHGTGTAIGDPTEVAALASVYGRPGEASAPRIGSVKANIGHLEAAAGVAGLLKAALAVARRTVPPQRAPKRLNPALHLDARGLVLPTRAEPWPLPGAAIAAVNSFGYGGTNAHAVVTEPPRPSPAPPVGSVTLVPITARGDDALRARAAQIADAIDAGTDFSALVGTLAHRRSHLEARVAVRADDPVRASRALRAFSEGHADPAVVGPLAASRRTVWVYSGMGPQWWGMGAELYAAEPAFAEGVDRACAALARADLPIRDALFLDRERSTMHRNDVAQPANFAIQVGLTAWLRARGASPDAILGHSTGEMAAAWAAGALTLDDAASVVAHRARLQQEVAGGGMLAVGCSAAELGGYLGGVAGCVEIAAYNAERSLTLAGDVAALDEVAARLEADGVFAKRVRVEVAYHSAHMDPIGPRLRAALATVAPKMPDVPLYSTVDGARVAAPCHDAAYWWRNTRGAVRLADAVRAAVADGCDTFVQIGPHPALAPAIGEVVGAEAKLPHLMRRGAPERETALAALAELWARGLPIDWAGLAPTGAPIALPTYPWQRRRLWRAGDAGSRAAHPLLGRRDDGPHAAWRARLDGAGLRWLHDHRIRGTPILPGAAWAEAMFAAATEADDAAHGVVLTDVRLHAALNLEDPGTVQELRTEVRAGEVAAHARTGRGPWALHAEARVSRGDRWGSAPAVDVGAARARCVHEVDVDALYDALARRGLDYGPAFRPLVRLWRGNGEVVAEVEAAAGGPFALHPAALDGAFQALLGVEPDSRRTLLPIGIERLRIGPARSDRWVVVGRVRVDDGATLVGDVTIVAVDGAPIAEVHGLRCKLLASPAPPRAWWHVPAWVAIDAGAPPVGTWRVEGAGGAAIASALAGAGVAISDRAENLLWIAPPASPGDDAAVAASLAETVRACVAAGRRLVVATRGAWSVAGSQARSVAHAALWGLVRVAMTEHPEIAPRLIDLDPDGAPSDAVAALAAADEEVAVRGGALFAARLRPDQGEGAAAPTIAVDAGDLPARLVATRPGDLSSLAYERCEVRDPAPGEVLLELDAASLNFKDVMKAMGMLDAVALERTYLGADLGMEAVGRVARAGAGVDLAPGQRAIVYHGGCLRTHLVADARFVVPCPEGWSDEDAASFFVAATAWHALVDVGRIRAGESVLVHSAAGGVGLAAIQIARAHGARVIATAGTPEKRAYLRSIGVEDVFDSRSLDFADGVLGATGGQGVDVVLNALAGAAIDRGLGCLRPGGRFLELGKKDLASDKRIGLLPFNRRLTFAAIDLDRAAAEDPGFFQPLARAVLDAFARGALTPLPARSFPVDRAEDAFRAFASGELIGKCVLRLRGGPIALAEPRASAQRPRPERTWLVTGGLGGFGLAAAGWLARRGVTDLVLASRRGAASGSDAARVAALRERARVREVALDVADPDAVAALIARIEGSGRPLGGVVHAAMVLDDRPLAALGRDELARVLAAKARGACNLHEATRGLDLDGFVLFSSISAQVGNPGQAAYAAANAALDGLAELRRGIGLPATSVAWGAIADVGVVARDRATAAHLRSVGLEPMDPDLALDALGLAIARGDARLTLADIDWNTWTRAHPRAPWGRLGPLLAAAPTEARAGLRDRLAALPEAERLDAAVDALRGCAAAVFRLDPADVDARRPLRDHGLDSLMAVELATAIDRGLHVEVSAMDLLGGRSLSGLAARVVEGLATGPSAPPARVAADALRAAIDVSAPYEAFVTLHADGDAVHATLRPDPVPGEDGPVASAEIGRHLAILGSMAASLRNPARGRHSYPVRSADLRVEDAAGPPVAEARAVARCTAFDPAAGTAAAEAELYDLDGRLLGSLRVTYNVMTVETLHALFAAHARPDGPAVDDPYRGWTPAPIVEASAERVEACLASVDPASCAGHFSGLPALPVSIMGRHVFCAVAEAAARAGLEGLRVRRAVLSTRRFVWAGQRARFVATPEGDAWRCEVWADDEPAATFRLDVVARATFRHVAK